MGLAVHDKILRMLYNIRRGEGRSNIQAVQICALAVLALADNSNSAWRPFTEEGRGAQYGR